MNILIVYHSFDYPLRSTIKDHLYCFERYSGHRCFYLNLYNRTVPWYLKSIDFDLVIFHTIFLSTRWNHERFQKLIQKSQPLKGLRAVKAVLPQDEFIHTDLVCDFINDFQIDWVYSVAPASEWPKIYHTVDFERVRFGYVLTGYLSDDTVQRIELLAREAEDRTIDIGYRAWKAEHWLGSHGFLKTIIADKFQELAPKRGLKIDISTRPQDTFLGDGWYRFLLQCKYTIGVEGGATILDRDGSIREKTVEYVRHHPDATFEEVESHCFPGMDGSLQLLAISPRHLEACVTKTCQILIEGDYNGILEAGKHYIELKRDFSNLDEVLELMEEDRMREEIIERAYRDIVETRRWTYKSFVDDIIHQSLDAVKGKPSASSRPSPFVSLLYHWMKLADQISWGRIAFSLLSRRWAKKIIQSVRKR